MLRLVKATDGYLGKIPEVKPLGRAYLATLLKLVN